MVPMALNEEVERCLKEQDHTVKFSDLGISTLSVDVIETIQKIAEKLTLKNNKIVSLPASFGALRSLRVLDLQNNQFSSFPEILTTMNLEFLDLSFNKIGKLPSHFGTLNHSLKMFVINNNQIEIIPKSLTHLTNLKRFEINGNPIKFPNESFLNAIKELDKLEWLGELVRFLSNNEYPATASTVPALTDNSDIHIPQLERSRSTSESYVSSRAAKRMGFIIKRPNPDLSNEIISEEEPAPKTLDPLIVRNRSLSTSNFDSSSTSTSTATSTSASTPNGNKSTISSTIKPEPVQSTLGIAEAQEPNSNNNDYFKRLSVLPERRFNLTQFKIVEISKKILFSITEFQTIIKKLNTVCTEKSIIIEMVSQLYYSKTVIDHLMEILEKTDESNEQNVMINSNDELVKCVFQIISIYKKMIDILQNNYQAYVKNIDICSIRMLLLTLFGSYSEIYNAYKVLIPEQQLTPEDLQQQHVQKKQHQQEPEREETQQPVQAQPQAQPQAQQVQPQIPSQAQPQTHSELPTPQLQTPAQPLPSLSNLNSVSASTSNIKSAKDIYNASNIVPHPTRAPSLPALNTSATTITQQQLNEYAEADENLYSSLNFVVQTSSLVYSELNEAISKSAIASATAISGNSNGNGSGSGSVTPEEINSTTIAKIKELTNTCVTSMDLNKRIKYKLVNDNIKNSTIMDKKKFYDEINALLKSIIMILGLTKSIINDLPTLNEVRPSLANLTKATKDVTVMLEVSSYRLINDSFNMNSAIPQSAIPTALTPSVPTALGNSGSANASITSASTSTSTSTTSTTSTATVNNNTALPTPASTIQPPLLPSIPSVMSIPTMTTPFLPVQTPPVAPHNQHLPQHHQQHNPFEATLANHQQKDSK